MISPSGESTMVPAAGYPIAVLAYVRLDITQSLGVEMKQQQRLTWIAIVAVLATFATACGGSGTGSDDDAATGERLREARCAPRAGSGHGRAGRRRAARSWRPARRAPSWPRRAPPQEGGGGVGVAAPLPKRRDRGEVVGDVEHGSSLVGFGGFPRSNAAVLRAPRAIPQSSLWTRRRCRSCPGGHGFRGVGDTTAAAGVRGIRLCPGGHGFRGVWDTTAAAVFLTRPRTPPAGPPGSGCPRRARCASATVPPWAATVASTIDRPRPLPPRWRDRDGSAR